MLAAYPLPNPLPCPGDRKRERELIVDSQSSAFRSPRPLAGEGLGERAGPTTVLRG